LEVRGVLALAEIIGSQPPLLRMNSKAPFGELVVAGCREMATRADCGRTLSRSHGHFDVLFIGPEVRVLIYRPLSQVQLAFRSR